MDNNNNKEEEKDEEDQDGASRQAHLDAAFLHHLGDGIAQFAAQVAHRGVEGLVQHLAPVFGLLDHGLEAGLQLLLLLFEGLRREDLLLLAQLFALGLEAILVLLQLAFIDRATGVNRLLGLLRGLGAAQHPLDVDHGQDWRFSGGAFGLGRLGMKFTWRGERQQCQRDQPDRSA